MAGIGKVLLENFYLCKPNKIKITLNLDLRIKNHVEPKNMRIATALAHMRVSCTHVADINT